MFELTSTGFWHEVTQLKLTKDTARILRGAITGHLRGSPPPIIRDEEFAAFVEAVGDSLFLDLEEYGINKQPVEVQGKQRDRVLLVRANKNGWDINRIGAAYDGRSKQE